MGMPGPGTHIVQRRRKRLAIVASLVFLVALVLADGHLMDGMRVVGYTVCHQMPERSLSVDGQHMPLCARCTGIYLGFVVGFLGMALLGKPGASVLPPGRVIALLLLSMVAMALDGLNSVLDFFPDSIQAYPPSNLLRLVTGTAAGTSLALLLAPLVNDALWATSDLSESVSDLRELVGYAVLVAMAALVAYADHPILFYPVSLASTLGVVAALTAAGTALAATLLRRERRATCLRDAIPLVLVGFGLAVAAMATTGIARFYFSIPLGL